MFLKRLADFRRVERKEIRIAGFWKKLKQRATRRNRKRRVAHLMDEPVKDSAIAQHPGAIIPRTAMP